MMKPKNKEDQKSSKEVSGSLISFWWKLSVKERKAHFHTIKIELLSPFLFLMNLRDEFCLHWATDVGMLKDKEKRWKGDLLDDDYKTIDLLEDAVTVLQDNLSKFDGNRYLDSMVSSMEKRRKKTNGVRLVIPSARNILKELNQEEWFRHFRSNMIESRKADSCLRDTVLLIASMQAFVYIKCLSLGDRPLERFKVLGDLTDEKSREEKERGNQFFSGKLYEKAISVYSNILRAKPFSHIIYCNRSQCYLTIGSYRLALADARRTIALEPSSEKGQYRYCRSLEFMGKYEDAARAVRKALDACPSSSDLEKLRKRIRMQLDPKGQNEKLKKILRCEDPPDLASPSSQDESSEDVDSSNYEDSEGGFSDVEDYDSYSIEAPDLYSDSDEWSDVDDEDDCQSPVKSKQKDFEKEKDKAKQLTSATKKKVKSKLGNAAQDQNLLDLNQELKKGTKYYIAGNYSVASSYFNLVLNLTKSAKNFSLRREDEVVLIYAIGMCSFESGSAEDLITSKKQFDLIIENFNDVNFPLAHYGCGRIFHKQSKFLDMHSAFQKSLEIIAKFGIVMRKWPGSDIVIEETRPGRLKQLIKDFLESLSCAPRPPDAICRFDACELDRNIFTDDIDFKGFIQIRCSESCKIEYHSICWQRVKKKLNFKDQSPLKEFLNRNCLTPDCAGVLYFMHYTFLNREGEIKSKEHKIELPKNQNKRVSKIDKSKRMKACSHKKFQKKSSTDKEKEKRKEDMIKEIDDDITSILNELDEEEQMSKLAKDKNLYVGPEPKLPKWWELQPTDPLSGFTSQIDNALFPLKKEDEVVSKTPTQTSKKRKKKSKKNKTNSSRSLTTFLGDEDTEKLRDVMQEVNRLERSSSFSSSVTSSSIDVSTSGTDRNHNFDMFGDGNQDCSRETVIDHLHSIFADLLISKGRMNVETDADVKDLLDILDSYSSRIITSWGGLRNFLASSSKFAFDPDEPEIVYLAEEAEIYLFSKREAAKQKVGRFDLDNEALSFNDNFGDTGSNKSKKAKSLPNDSNKPYSDYKIVPQDVRNDCWRTSESKNKILHDTVENASEKSVVGNSLARLSEQYKKGQITKKMKKKDVPNGGGAPFSKADVEKLRHDIIRQSDQGQVYPNKLSSGDRIGQKMVDATVMTENGFYFDDQEAADKDLYDSYVSVMDNCEQLKNKLKIEKEATAVKEAELKDKIESLKSKLMKEQQSRESVQKKWQQEKEKMNGTIKSLYEKIAKFDEESYKVKLKDHEREVAKMTTKIGEMKLQQERMQSDNQDIISKLSNCVTEQSIRAQKAEVSFMELKKMQICGDFKRNLDSIQGTIYMVDNNPFLDSTMNRVELSKLWKAHFEAVTNSMRKCMATIDERIQLLKDGTPLDEIQPFTLPQTPTAPPQPKMMPMPANVPNPSPATKGAAIQMPQGMPTIPFANMPLPPTMMPNDVRQKAVNPTNGAPNESIATAAAASVPTSNEGVFNSNEGTKTIVASSHSDKPKGDLSVKIASLNGEKAATSKSNEKAMSKSTSFEKIMAKLCNQFPSISRDELIKFLKEFREKRKNTLAGLRVEEIITSVAKMIKESSSHDEDFNEQIVKRKAKPFGFEEPCIICHDDMVVQQKTTRLQCHHVFHSDCINRWLKEQRTCPTCRNHALLPEEFPSLM